MLVTTPSEVVADTPVRADLDGVEGTNQVPEAALKRRQFRALPVLGRRSTACLSFSPMSSLGVV
jgi:hypothetical protein